MEPRIARMEATVDHLGKGLDALRSDVKDGFKAVNDRFDRVDAKLDKLPNEWTMAKVVFFVVGSLMAAAVFGPRLVALLGS